MAGSPLAQLKARHSELVAAQEKDVPVPGWDEPTLTLRIRPVDHVTLRRLGARIGKGSTERQAEAELAANAAIVADATVAVLVGSGAAAEEATLSQVGEAFGLGADVPGAEVIRHVVTKDGYVLALAEAVMKHSGYGTAAADEATAGE